MTASIDWKILSVDVPSEYVLVGYARVRCRLTVTLGPLLMTGLTLVTYPDGAFAIWMPKSRGNRIVVRDPAARDSLLALAISTFSSTVGVPADLPVAKASLNGVGNEHSRNA